MKVMRFLLGLVIGAGVALLVAPKSGRELREQLVGAAGDRMLGAPPEAYPGPDVAASWDVDSDWSGAATAVAEPSVAVEPAAEKPLVEPPAAEEAPEEAPVLEEPAVEPEPDEVVAEEPAVEQPAVEQPAAEEAAVAEAPPRPFPVWEQHPEEPAGEDLRARIEETRETLEAELAEPFAQEAAEQEVVDEVAPAEVVAEEVEVLDEAGAAASEAPAAAESPVVEEPAVVEEPVADETVIEEQALEAPVPTGEALPEAPVAEAPGAETAVAEVAPEDSAAESPREGGVIDQAEMRRRIEETRARLKAKAFDAMMSGEAALLARDSGDKPVPKGDDHGLDAETDSVIDESLSQEEY